ncbi:hypothetical protein COJ30_11320 [Bacillus anthracis]|uniref:Tyr recombinase domain-containing protein n=1 Tax=Bacillus anthracis TaxID=1392 RepID=A0A2B0Y288_BACAN|nr:hypothetical protein COJ30_11320 [Bacillus anthracis]
MLQAGDHPKMVQDRLGHSSTQMTLDKYSHITQNMQQQAAENFENVILIVEHKPLVHYLPSVLFSMLLHLNSQHYSRHYYCLIRTQALISLSL